MDYRVSMKFEPLHELISSIHTYICRKSYKKIDLTSTWAKETQTRLTPELSDLLDETDVGGSDWRLIYLLVHVCPSATNAEHFLTWLEGLTVGDLYELLSEYGNYFPEHMGTFRSRMLTLVSQWNEQYFAHIDPKIIQALRDVEQERNKVITALSTAEFIDETTYGLQFKPMNGLEEIILIPQYHFQPVNVVAHYGKITICHYAARIYFEEEDFISPHEYRMIRCLGEKSRLKILRYLNKGPRSFIEIVRHLELSKGITHDHVSKLRSAGLIYAHFEGETLTEYSLRSNAFRQLQKLLIDYIEQP